MKILKFTTLLFICGLAFWALKKPDPRYSTIVHKKDLSAFLTEIPDLTQEEAELDFWQQKMEADPLQFVPLVKLGHAHSALFQKTGKIEHLTTAEAHYRKANDLQASRDAGLLRTLSQNMITQHRFQEALAFADQALALGENRAASELIRFDALMEVGQYEEAHRILIDHEQPVSVDYLIRLAKYKDFVGELDTTVELLEKCKAEAHSPAMQIWLASNLGDYYGHQGALEQSYQAYLETLDKDPGNWYALKGIAWIAYSNDRNPELALELINASMRRNHSPGLLVWKAEVLAYMNRKQEAEALTKQFIETVQDEAYGQLYRAQLAELWAEDPIKANEAVRLAHLEVEERPGIEAYDLLAWSLFLDGQVATAKHIADTQLWDKTGEPGVLLHLSKIYAQTNELDKFEFCNTEVLSSIYELGPLTVGNL
ncbi:MAG: hypothetical protein AAFV80_21160 [Bacteroidota bacterium]